MINYKKEINQVGICLEKENTNQLPFIDIEYQIDKIEKIAIDNLKSNSLAGLKCGEIHSAIHIKTKPTLRKAVCAEDIIDFSSQMDFVFYELEKNSLKKFEEKEIAEKPPFGRTKESHKNILSLNKKMYR